MMGFSIEDIESALAANNVEPGSMTVRDGYYEYNIKFSTLLRTAEDVKNIYLRKGDRIVQLKDFCKVTIVPVKEKRRICVEWEKGGDAGCYQAGGREYG